MSSRNNNNRNYNRKSRSTPSATHFATNEKRSKVSFRRVTELVTKDPDTIMLEIMDPKFGIDEYMDTAEMGDEFVLFFTQSIEKALCKCNSMKQNKLVLSTKLNNSNYLTKALYKAIEKKDRFQGTYNFELIRSAINICNSMLHVMPSSRFDMESLVERIELIVSIRLKDKELTEEFQEKVRKLIDEENNQQSKNQINEVRKVTTFTNTNDHLEPPNKIADISIAPVLDEINNNQKPFLRKNITSGPYRDVSHYLDIHFRLLREDFMQPLRKGIVEFKSIIEESKKTANGAQNISKEIEAKLKRIESLYVYQNVKFVSNLCIDSGVAYTIRLDIEKTKNVNWEMSKRLLYGSLVCLSNDYFTNNLIVASILDRDTEKLKNGVISIKIDSNTHENQNNFGNDLDSNYIMLETSAYFEAYRHVLTALQDLSKLDENNFPFKKEIVECKLKDMGSPRYLANAFIDFRPIVTDTKTVKINSNTGISEYLFSSQSNYASNCYVTSEMQWPSPKQMNFDESQYAALKVGLTKKIALIQGPPGTGKTFIGVKLMQILLHNKNLWWNTSVNGRPKPILMICFTNHALDQFLELCIKECHLNSGVVRIGGRCKTPGLEGFLLRNIKDKLRGERKIDSSIFYQLKEQQKKLYNLQQQLNIHISYLNLCEEGILKMEALSGIVSPIIQKQLTSNTDLLDWLGFINITKSNTLIDLNFEIIDKFSEINTQEETDVEDLELLEEDIDDEEEERMLEEDIFVNQSFKSKNKKGHAAFTDVTDYISNKADLIFTEKDMKELFGDSTNKNNGSEWKTVTGRNSYKQEMNYYKNLLNILNTKSVPRDIVTHNIWNLKLKDRLSLYSYWVHCFKEQHRAIIEQMKNEYNNASLIVKELRMQEDRIIMQNSFIVAMTTTGSARYHTILKDLGPKIVIVEEAAEVFEAHIISALSKSCEHLILIGDHVQLRPKPNVYELERNYRLDVSLFERLLTNGCQHVYLTCQHRMRPEISILMKHFYGFEITNHDSVYKFENVRGIKKNIFFISHTSPEETIQDSKSHVNKYEIRYFMQLVKFLMKQRYDPSQITILTTYLGQMFHMREELRKFKQMKTVKLCTVDNYQGEENDIILLSLVRSNNNERIGFLAIENRICVALSRARKGLYCIGNFNLLNKTSAKYRTKWSQIIETLKESQSIGTGLPLSCGYHPKNDIIATDPSDFDKRPEGGCNSGCEYRLKCGHVCSYFCHTYDPDHEMIKCTKNCNKTMLCGHACPQKCGHQNKCDNNQCKIEVIKRLDCGHKEKLRCNQPAVSSYCRNKCSRALKCGHNCTKSCSDQPCEPCLQNVNCTNVCKDTDVLKVPCRLKDQIWKHQELCKKTCLFELDCGHLCTFECGECFGGRIHKSCVEKCDRNLICGHKCKVPCAKQCPPCTNKCENRCSHSYCPEKCSAPCKPCREPCSWKCIHQKCTKLCFELCDRTACQEPCKNFFEKCGHKCVGFCGEPCPPLCGICNKAQLTEIFFGTEDDPNARFILLEDCGHIFESTGLTDWMAQCVQGSPEDQSVTIKLPECPRCKTPIRRNLRYSNYVKRQLQAIELVKNKLSGTEIEIQAKKVEFIQYMNSQIGNLEDCKIVKDIIDEANLKKNLTTIAYYTLQNKWLLYNALKELEKKVLKGKEKEQNDTNCLMYELQKIKNVLLISKCVEMKKEEFKNRLTQEKISQINDELERIKNLEMFFCFKNNLLKNESKRNNALVLSLLQYLDQNLIRSIRPYKSIEKGVKDAFKKLQPFTSGLQISEDERLMILKAMNLTSGHWYQCPNQHVYCITECGGANQISKCPECGEQIGGSNHALLPTNRVATAMDGARHPAWSDYMNNMANFNMNDIV